MREKLLAIFENASPKVDYLNEDKLLDSGYLDSFLILNIIGEIEEEFDIEFSPDDLTRDNLNSFLAIENIVKGLIG